MKIVPAKKLARIPEPIILALVFSFQDFKYTLIFSF